MRDSVIGREPSDWDISTPAKPDEIRTCFSSYKVIDTGIQHGTVTVLMDGLSVEITTFRIDGEYIDHRRPESVTFTKDVMQDLSRRDFTMNAMAYSPTEGLYDPFDGVSDIESGIVRCVGDAAARFREDALRLLRLFRFAAQLEFDVEDESLNAAVQCRFLLDSISKERIASELNKILVSENPRSVLTLLSDTGIMSIIIPQWKHVIGFEQFSPYHDRTVDKHIIDATQNAPNDFLVRLSLLLHDIGKPYTFTVDEDGRGHCYGHEKIGAELSTNILKRLKYDNKTINSVYNLVLYHDQGFETRYSVGKILDELGTDDFYRLLELKRADAAAHCPSSAKYRLGCADKMAELADEILDGQVVINLKSLNINGNHIKDMGLAQGKEIGLILDRLLDMVMNGELENDYDCLINRAREMHMDKAQK